MLSKKGAKEMVDAFYNFDTKLFNLSSLSCINSDICLPCRRANRYAKMPPKFIPYLRSNDSAIVSNDSLEMDMKYNFI